LLPTALKHYYLKPAIIMGTPSANGGEAAIVRMRNLRHGQGCEGWCFEYDTPKFSVVSLSLILGFVAQRAAPGAILHGSDAP